jgi:hypothetical protein
MPNVSNSRSHVQVFEGVRLNPGNNDITDDQLKALQASKSFEKAQARGWVGVQRDRTADADVKPGKPLGGARVTSDTHPARPDGSAPAPDTKPEEAPLDYPEALSKAKHGRK